MGRPRLGRLRGRCGRRRTSCLRIGVVIGGDDAVAEGAIDALLDQADYMDENGKFPAEDELAGYERNWPAAARV